MLADPLSLLREFVSTGKIEEVVLAGDRVDFGGKFSFSKNMATGYKSQQGKGNFYDLETLLFFSKHVNVKFGEYFRKAGKEIGKQVSFVDRKDLHEYLTGEKDRSEFIHLAVPNFEVGGQPAKRARLEGDGEAEAGPAAAAVEEEEETAEGMALRRIRENEFQLRDRNSMLSMPGRSFRKALTILSQSQRQQVAQYNSHEVRKKQQAPKPVIPVRPSGRYERQTQQDATLKQMGAAELGVQVGFKPTTAAGSSAGAQRDAVPPRPPPVASSSLSPSQQQQQQRRQPSSRQQQRHPQQQAQNKAPQRHGTPVIMVPPGMTALLNMYNIRSFLEGGEFRTTEQAKAEKTAKDEEEQRQAEEAARAADKKPPKAKKAGVKEERISIERTVGRKAPVKYYVTDKEPAHKQDWERVVAVICLGKAWQFKKWPFKGAGSGDLVETFSKVLGVFVHYTDEAVDATVKSWNVKILSINRGSRHRDATVAQEFWHLLDAHLQARSSTLAF